jgi:hypothetical protein
MPTPPSRWQNTSPSDTIEDASRFVVECTGIAAVLALGFVVFLAWRQMKTSAEASLQLADQKRTSNQQRALAARDEGRRLLADERALRRSVKAAWHAYKEVEPAKYEALRTELATAFDGAFTRSDDSDRLAADSLQQAYDNRVNAWFNKQSESVRQKSFLECDQEEKLSRIRIGQMGTQARLSADGTRNPHWAMAVADDVIKRVTDPNLSRKPDRRFLERWIGRADGRLNALAREVEQDADIYFNERGVMIRSSQSSGWRDFEFYDFLRRPVWKGTMTVGLKLPPALDLLCDGDAGAEEALIGFESEFKYQIRIAVNYDPWLEESSGYDVR